MEGLKGSEARKAAAEVRGGERHTLITIDKVEDEAGLGQLRRPLGNGRIPVTGCVHRLSALAVQDLPGEVRTLACLKRPLADCDRWQHDAREFMRTSAKNIEGGYRTLLYSTPLIQCGPSDPLHLACPPPAAWKAA